MYCKTKVVEIAGSEITAVDDAVDVSNGRTLGYLCPGQYRSGCTVWYYFEEIT
jgi:hypothetical protein